MPSERTAWAAVAAAILTSSTSRARKDPASPNGLMSSAVGLVLEQGFTGLGNGYLCSTEDLPGLCPLPDIHM